MHRMKSWTSRMMIMIVVMMVVTRTVFTVDDQNRCDPLTQYKLNGECCAKCRPGTSMMADSPCQDPQCVDCGDNEYQDTYTTEKKCQRQLYCDAHKNLEADGPTSKKKQITCVCKQGYHCTTSSCLTCMLHTECEPGQEAKTRGNQTNDTVCRKCPVGTFSSVTSSTSSCTKWTECPTGYHVAIQGTETSDNICEQDPRSHAIVISIIVALGIVAGITVAIYLLCKGKRAKTAFKGCVESCHEDKQEPQREVRMPIMNPIDDCGPIDFDKELSFPEQQSTQEEHSLRTPEENEDELSMEASVGIARTDMGNYVMQDKGESEKLPRQESQTQPESEVKSSF